MDMEMIVMGLIANAGECRSLAYEALSETKEGNHEKASELLKSANQSILRAHKTQTELIQSEAAGKKVEVSLLMVHAQDHLMNAILAKELVEELIDLHKKLEKVKK